MVKVPRCQSPRKLSSHLSGPTHYKCKLKVQGPTLVPAPAGSSKNHASVFRKFLGCWNPVFCSSLLWFSFFLWLAMWRSTEIVMLAFLEIRLAQLRRPRSAPSSKQPFHCNPFPPRLLANRCRNKGRCPLWDFSLAGWEPFNIIYLVQVRYYPATGNGQEIIPTQELLIPGV